MSSELIVNMPEPLAVESAADLNHRTQNIINVISEVTEDWETRLNAINMIARLAVGGAKRYPDFLQLLNDLKQCFLVQCQDLRSAIMKATFEMLQVLSIVVGVEFQPIAFFLIPDIIKMSASAKSATAKITDVAIRVMLFHTHATRLLPKLLLISKQNKNSIIRASVARYSCLLIEIAAPGEIDRFNDDSIEGFVAMLTDKQNETRKYARNAYAMLKDYNPSIANTVHVRLDQRTQESLLNASSESTLEGLNSSRDMSMSVGAAPPKTAAKHSRQSIGRPPSRVADDSSTRSDTRYVSEDSRALTAPGRGRSSASAAPESSIRTLPQRSVEMDEEEKAYRLPPKGRAAATPVRPHSGQAAGTPGRVPKTAGTPARPASVNSTPQRAAVPPKPPVQRPSSAVSEDAEVDDKGYGLEELSFVLEKADSKDWTERLESFRALGMWFGVTPDGNITCDLSGVNNSEQVAANIKRRMNDIPLSIEHIAELFANRLMDSHTRVVLEVMRSLVSLVEGYCGSYVLTNLEKIITKLYNKLVDGKVQIRQAGSDVIQSVVNAFESDALLPVLLKTLDQVMLKIKPYVLRTIVALIPHCELWVSKPVQMKGGLQRFVILGQEKIPDVRKASISCIVACYEVSNDTFLAAVLQLPPAMQVSLKQLVVEEIPELSSKLSAYASNMQQQVTMMPVEQENAEPKPEPPKSQPKPSMKIVMEELKPVEQAPRTAEPVKPAAEFIKKPEEVPARTEPRPEARSEPRRVPDQHSTHSTRPAEQPVRQAEPQRVKPQTPAAQQHAYPPVHAVTTQPKKPSVDDEWKAIVQTIPSSVAAGGDAKEFTLKKLIQMSIDNPRQVWKQYFGQMLLLVLECARDPNPTVRTLAIRVSKEMLMRQHSYFNDYINVVMIRLLDAIRDNEREVVLAAEESLDTLVSNLDPLKCMEVIVPLVLTEQSPVLQAAIRLLARLSTRLEADVLMELLPSIQPGLYDAFRHPNADVRKAVVFCLVDMYGVLGDAFTPYLAKLSTSQLKLVTIYINRMKTSAAPAPAPHVLQVDEPTHADTIVPGKFSTPKKPARV